MLPLRILRCPIAFPAMTYYQLWHDLTHHSAAGRWLRDQVREVARGLSAAKGEHDFGATLAAPAPALPTSDVVVVRVGTTSAARSRGG